MKKNFQLLTHNEEWSKKRFIVRIENQRTIEAIRDDLEYRMKKIQDDADEQIRKLKDEASERILMEKLRMHDRLAEIAAEQDAFEDEFRNYAASLPKEDVD